MGRPKQKNERFVAKATIPLLFSLFSALGTGVFVSFLRLAHGLLSVLPSGSGSLGSLSGGLLGFLCFFLYRFQILLVHLCPCL